ncbi:methyl-accepting chemotaxis protein [Acetanaerobacterium elongatum]|uniref:Methyl-accepting chemotaxis sensory transducer n=1 Tax=Acetanaerobacterium elongatum TaxID=258515 RepID=A0A1H0F7N7_9FIRM|nr:methyl-accepting chemotaxis protein [Acetanaerobacterium elongatum]SDN90633.1 methyl-accepting chemotaxis sensory transducer [Acetanaerobacterium elongatum]
MKRLKDLSIKRKLISGFLAVCIITALVGAVGIFGMIQLNAASEKMFEKQTAPLHDLTVIIDTISQIRIQMRTAALWADNAEKLNSAQKEFEGLKAKMTEAMDAYMPTISSSESIKLAAEAKQLYTEKLIPGAEKIFKAAQSGNIVQTRDVGSELTEPINKISSNFNQCLENKIENASKINESNKLLALILIIILGVVMLLGIFTAIFLGSLIAKRISQPIAQVVAAADELALGNTNISVDADSDDETGMLASAFNRMITGIKEQADIVSSIADGDLSVEVTPRSEQDTLGIALKQTSEKLNKILSNINIAAEQVLAGSEQVSIGSQTLSQGSIEQASSVEQLSASLEEVSAQVTENAESIRQVVGHIEEASAGVNKCNDQMQLMLKSMAEISNSSNQISKIIKVIDDISFQTNILALNAAVEAARAGAAGKGFAVVADEVRSLASKCAESAKQTTVLIENSGKAVENGAKIAEDTAVYLEEVKKVAAQINVVITRIESASSNQAEAIQQINAGVEQISAVVQNNSATAEESAASSEELSAQAKMLKEQIASFKLQD